MSELVDEEGKLGGEEVDVEESENETDLKELRADLERQYLEILTRGVRAVKKMLDPPLPPVPTNLSFLSDDDSETDDPVTYIPDEEINTYFDFEIEEGALFSEDYLVDIIRRIKRYELLTAGDSFLDKLLAHGRNDEIELLARLLHKILDRDLSKKIDSHRQKKGYVLDLNRELRLLEELDGCETGFGVRDLLLRAGNVLKSDDLVNRAVISHNVYGGFQDYLGHLGGQGRYRHLLQESKNTPNREIRDREFQCIMDAYVRTAYVIDFDSNGMPVTNDPNPQYKWADLNRYREQFYRILSSQKDAETQEVPTEALKIMERASVAELLRKLINMDLGYGELNDVNSTRVGLFSEAPSLKKLGIISEVFEDTAINLKDLIRPLMYVLQTQQEAFWQKIEDKFKDRFETLGPRIKSIESILLKMLKMKDKDWGTMMDVTDIVGGTILTDTEDEVNEVYAEIEKMMIPGTIKGHDMWEKESSRGRRSKDITGLPDGFLVKMQVQCRTKEMEELFFGRLANHTAYKKISGDKLLWQVCLDPDAYLDLLHRVITNLRCAYDECWDDQNEAGVCRVYGKEYPDSHAIVRTGVLY